MADSKQPIIDTIEAEGLYSNDPEDTGKETVLGLTRVADADWNGWFLVDQLKKQPNFPDNLEASKTILTSMATSYYKKKYWNAIRGDEILNQDEANSIFDMYVNKGKTAIILAQRALGIEETGHMDNFTLNTINKKV
jgi:lysozyme family protein